jgi:glutamine phosphoribosylpyrophosphate amidotransferase
MVQNKGAIAIALNGNLVNAGNRAAAGPIFQQRHSSSTVHLIALSRADSADAIADALRRI